MGRFRTRRRPYPRDPHWIEARYSGTCRCGKPITIGDRVFHFPNDNITYCTGCSDDVSRRAAAELADDDFMCAR